MNLRLTKLNEFQLLTCVKHGVWGSKNARFGKWKAGDFLAFMVGKKIAGMARVSGKPFTSREPVWDNGLFPNRIPVEFTHLMLPQNRPSVLGPIRDSLLASAAGTSYGMYILNQTVLPAGPADTIFHAIKAQPNDLPLIQDSLDHYLETARNEQKHHQKPTASPVDDAANEEIESQVNAAVDLTDTEDSMHSKYQTELLHNRQPRS